MNPAKIHLSADELALVQNGHMLLTKNAIIEKVVALFGELASYMQQHHHAYLSLLPAGVTAISPKISKGEKYQGLPYVILDYPRLFGREEIFAIRTLFWWGNYFSVTLHLRGRYKAQYEPALKKHLPLLQENHFYISISADEWQHDLTIANYTPLDQLDLAAVATILSGNDFCKLSVRISLQQWDQLEKILTDLYQVIFQTITND